MEDGEEICRQHVAKTFVEAIKKIEVERVKSLHMESCGISLLDTKKHHTYSQTLVEGYYIMTNTTTDDKIEQLDEIKRRLNLDIQVIDNR